MRSAALTLFLAAVVRANPVAAAPAADVGANDPAKPVDAKKAVKKGTRQRELPGDIVEFQTSDGWKITASYQPAKEEQPTFILLHDARGRRQNWYWLARKMEHKGIGYLALDMRGHGQSQNAPAGKEGSWRAFRQAKRDNDWESIREDVAAAMAFLEAADVPVETISLGGADVGGSIALKYAALHEGIEMVFLLSPGFSYREVLTVNAMRAYKMRPILMVVADDDRHSSTETPILFEFAKRSVGQENATLLRVEKGHGTRMLYYNKGLTDSIVDWIEDPVVPPDVDLSSGTTMNPFDGDDGPPDEDDDGLPDESGPEGSAPATKTN